MTEASRIREQDARAIDSPEPGFYKMRVAKGGAEVGAMIQYGPGVDPDTGEPMDRSYLWYGEINGKPTGPVSPDPATAGVFKIWISRSQPITEAEYKFLIADRAWARQHAPDTPEANPYRAVVLEKKPGEAKTDHAPVDIRDIPITQFMP